jgi:hypothetical protein
VTIDGTEFTSGESVGVTVDLTAATGSVRIEASGGANHDFVLEDCNPGSCDDEGLSDNIWIIQDDDLTEITLTFSATCDETEEITISASQGGEEASTDTIECQAFNPNVTVINDANGATVDFDFTVSGDASCNGTVSLGNDETGEFACDEDDTYTITQAAETGWTLSAINCTDTGITDSAIVTDLAARTVTFPIGAGDSIECTFVNVAAGTATPTVTGTPSGATGVTVSAAPSTVNCSGSSFITVVVKSGTANVADGTTVSVTTTSGSLSPTSAPTSGGGILTIFTAGSTSGTATITASAGGQTGTTTVTVNCGQPTAVPTSPPPPPPVQTVAPGGGIRPPNTGDAGLVADGGTNWMIAGIVAVIATSAAGGLVLARRRF